MFLKNMSFQPITSKQDFQTFYPKFSTLERILFQNHGIYSLRWTKQNSHTILCTNFSKE